jgi:hypothetical protein
MALITYIPKDTEIEKRVEDGDCLFHQSAGLHSDHCTCFASIHTVEKKKPQKQSEVQGEWGHIMGFNFITTPEDSPNKLHREMEASGE